MMSLSVVLEIHVFGTEQISALLGNGLWLSQRGRNLEKFMIQRIFVLVVPLSCHSFLCV